MVDNPLANINPQALQEIMGMINRGADAKELITAFKKTGMSPQVLEQLLCMVNPQFKQLKQKMDGMRQSGMSQQDMFAKFAKDAKVDPSQINNTYDNLMKLVR